MRVLVGLCDAESSTGGGETIYRQIFRLYPKIEFTYLLDREPLDYPRPPNVRGLRIGTRYSRDTSQTSLLMECFCWANTIARTIRNESFDVIDIPDYMSDFCLVPAALAQIGVMPRIAVGLNGSLRQSLEQGWRSLPEIDPNRRLAQELLFGWSDVRYGYSQSYLDDWHSVSPLPTQFVNPRAWLTFPPLQRYRPADHAPNLHFVGRTERWKGPDFFVQMLWQLPRGVYNESSIIGPPVAVTRNLDSNTLLREMIRSRQLNTTVVGKKTQAELLKLYATHSITVVPSRYDAFNLAALESLLSGCPTVIGSNAGVCRYLINHLPAVPFTPIDLNNIDAAGNEVAHLAFRYEDEREKLAAAVRSLPESVPLPDMEAIYALQKHDAAARDRSCQLFEQFLRSETNARPSVVWRAKQWASRSPRLLKAARYLKDQLASDPSAPVATRPLKAALQGWTAFRRAGRMPAKTPEERQVKIEALLKTTHLVGRRCLWSEVARLSHLSGQDLQCAAFALRALRLSGRDCDEMLSLATKSLTRSGFSREAHLAELMYGDYSETVRNQHLTSWLQQRCDEFRSIPDFPFEVVQDHRDSSQPRISILVAINRSQPPSASWWREFEKQTVIRNRQAEVLLVEYQEGPSKSEYSSNLKSENDSDVRHVMRIRIGPSAQLGQVWNQGLRFARAPYVALVTAHEQFRPTGLELLTNELDARPDLNWLQSQALEIESDTSGEYVRDLEYHDRSAFDRELATLDMHAISLAGSVYRRTLHQSCGYFDSTLWERCDLEFVQRAAPSIELAFYPQTLSVIHGRPERCQTRTFHREIELLRAWDIFRNPAGIQRVFELHRDRLTRAIQFSWRHPGRFPSHGFGQASSDVEFTARLADFALGKTPDVSAIQRTQLGQLLNLYRQVDAGFSGNSLVAVARFWRVWASIRWLRRQLSKSLGDLGDLCRAIQQQ